MKVEIDEPEIIERVAALDVGRAELVCCAGAQCGRQRMQEVRTLTTMTAGLRNTDLNLARLRAKSNIAASQRHNAWAGSPAADTVNAA
jgi:hypothetical protein